MEVDHHLIKDCHSSNKKPGGGGGSKLLYQATAGKDMTVRGLCDGAEPCGLLNVTPFFPYATDWKKRKTRRRVVYKKCQSGESAKTRQTEKGKRSPHDSLPYTSLYLCITRPLVNIMIYSHISYTLELHCQFQSSKQWVPL